MRALFILPVALILAGPAAADNFTVEIKTFQFMPKTLTVKVGDTVTWTNNDGAEHSATAAGAFDTGLFAKGESRTLAFDTAGTFAYRCSRHGSMTGEIVVTP
jgi:plastocyanin